MLNLDNFEGDSVRRFTIYNINAYYVYDNNYFKFFTNFFLNIYKKTERIYISIKILKKNYC